MQSWALVVTAKERTGRLAQCAAAEHEYNGVDHSGNPVIHVCKENCRAQRACAVSRRNGIAHVPAGDGPPGALAKRTRWPPCRKLAEISCKYGPYYACVKKITVHRVPLPSPAETASHTSLLGTVHQVHRQNALGGLRVAS